MSILVRIYWAVAVCAISLSSANTLVAAEPTKSVISVSATGSASAKPDIAIVDLAGVHEAKTARDALDMNSEAMGKVLAELKASGIAESDLQTSSFNIQPLYAKRKTSSLSHRDNNKSAGYRVSNQLTVKVRDLARLGTIIDRAVELGVNAGGNVQFTVENPVEVIRLARQRAVASAIAKANTLSEAAGVKLGSLLELKEGTALSPRAPVRVRVMEASSSAVPIASGESVFRVTVQARWSIEP
ncbi:MAG: SIMPL domain-containing protein [Pseudomonadota bacterium]